MRDIVKEEQRRAIGAVKKSLSWQVTVVRRGLHRDLSAYQMRSIPSERRHEICLPFNGDGLPYDRLSELHEYVHALLAEQSHPVFGVATLYAIHPGDDEWVWGVVNEATDWFVHSWICRKHSIAFRDAFERNAHRLDPCRLANVLSRLPPTEVVFSLAVSAGMAAGLRLFRDWQGTTGDPCIEAMAGEFLRTDAERPSLEAVVSLANRLLVRLGLGLVVSAGADADGGHCCLVSRKSDGVIALQRAS